MSLPFFSRVAAYRFVVFGAARVTPGGKGADVPHGFADTPQPIAVARFEPCLAMGTPSRRGHRTMSWDLRVEFKAVLGLRPFGTMFRRTAKAATGDLSTVIIVSRICVPG